MNGAAATASLYTVIRIPASSQRITELVIKFRDTKLAAIKADPEGNFARFEVESQLPDSVWKARLAGNTNFLVCVTTTDASLSPEDVLLQGDWAGYAALRERVSYEQYYAAPEMNQPVPEHPELEERWHLYDLYTLPAHRGRNVAKQLMDGCIALVENALTMDDSSKKARIRLMANPTRSWLIDWYRRFGFIEGGRANLRQGFVANGMQDSVPKDTTSTQDLRDRWETPFGLIMERVLESA
jgi:ribosomal protein S18 acetylase RimI-like enzyme